MKLRDLNESSDRLSNIRLSMALTVIDPKRARVEIGKTKHFPRLKDCYSQVAQAVRNEKVTDDAQIIYYGINSTPTHAVVVNNGSVVVDAMEHDRITFDHRTKLIQYESKLGDENLEVVHSESVRDFKHYVASVYNKHF